MTPERYWSGRSQPNLEADAGENYKPAVLEEERKRGRDADCLADRIVAAFAAGERYLPALAELCALCEDAGLDHAAVLDDAVRRAARAA